MSVHQLVSISSNHRYPGTFGINLYTVQYLHLYELNLVPAAAPDPVDDFLKIKIAYEKPYDH